MKYYRFLNISDQDAGDEAFMKGLQQGKPKRGTWLVVLTETPGHLIEIVSPGLKEWRIKKKERSEIVIGAASSQEGAVEISGALIRSCYEETGGLDIRKYLSVKYGEVL